MQKNTRIIYASSAMREEDFVDLFESSSKIPGQQAQKFNRLMIKGLVKNGARVYAISAPPINNSNCSSRIKFLGKRKDGNLTIKYLPIFNFKWIKNVIVFLTSFCNTVFASFARDAVIVCDVLNVSVAMGAVSAGRLLGKRCVGIVTDLPELMVTGHTPKMVTYCHKVINKCTNYVFLTEPMNEALNPYCKPYIVIEGICDEDVKLDEISQNRERAALYAGLLDADYGVKNMVDAFLKADIPGCVLHICGSGPYVDELKEIVKSHKNVEYHGVLLNKAVMEMEKKVSLLINPRPSTGKFTKYSFPSKNMEYMTSGTPVLAMRLAGIPGEYYNYMYTFSGESVEEMAENISFIFKQPYENLNEMGRRAYEFVVTNKNAVAQTAKLLNLLCINK